MVPQQCFLRREKNAVFFIFSRGKMFSCLIWDYGSFGIPQNNVALEIYFILAFLLEIWSQYYETPTKTDVIRIFFYKNSE